MISAPYSYFGSKSKIATAVWQRFGKCDTYIEPFFGSGAMLLANPRWESTVETINDLDHFIVNFWRAIKAEPERVAEYADYPVVEVDLHARHAWLVNTGHERITQCASDPDFYDVQVAGWWVWGISLWIGGEFASGRGGWTPEHLAIAEKLKTYDLAKINLESTTGHGVSRRFPHLIDRGKGITRQLMNLGNAGQGINRKFVRWNGPKISLYPTNYGLIEYMQQLAYRMKNVRVLCGDWERMLHPAVTWAREENAQQAICGIFLDPPYSSEANRTMNIYTHDNGDVAHAVRAWCIMNENNSLMRIALCGYADEGHEELEAHGWSVLHWKANKGYSTNDNNNRTRETIWFSPHCPAVQQMKLL